MKPLRKIRIGLESYEDIYIEAADIGSFALADITKTVIKEFHSTGFFETENIGFAILVLKPSANKELADQTNGKTVFERLTNYNDITDITLYYKDKKQGYSVYWEGAEEHDFENKKQFSKISPEGFLIITIGRDETENIAKQF